MGYLSYAKPRCNGAGIEDAAVLDGVEADAVENDGLNQLSWESDEGVDGSLGERLPHRLRIHQIFEETISLAQQMARCPTDTLLGLVSTHDGQQRYQHYYWPHHPISLVRK